MPHSDKLIEGHNCNWFPAFLRLADIQREAELLQKMDHPNIAALALDRLRCQFLEPLICEFQVEIALQMKNSSQLGV